MEKISGFSDDDLLVKILSFLPTKLAVRTSVLSKRWKYIWKRVLKLEYDDNDVMSAKSASRFRRFVKKNLQTNRDSALESLSLSFGAEPFRPEDIESWVGFAVSRGVRELKVAYFPSKHDPARLPDWLYVSESLVSLKLVGMVWLRSVPSRVCLPSLKSLELRNDRWWYQRKDETLERFLCNCPVLENLIVEHNDGKLSVSSNVPSLQRLSIEISDVSECVINTPSLKYFKVKVIYCYQSYSIANMPNLEEADIEVINPDTEVRNPDTYKFFKPISSVKRLSLCLRFHYAEDVDNCETVFNQLEHLKICTCDQYWSKLLIHLLKFSPKLRVVELYLNWSFFYKHSFSSVTPNSPIICWENQTSYDDPQCFVTSLETFKWTECERRPEERELIEYILSNARCLNTAIINNFKIFSR